MFARKRLAVMATLLLAALAATSLQQGPSFSSTERQKHPRAFGDHSYWNTRLPAKAPKHANSNAILNYMRSARESGGGCIRLAGTGSNSWGQPIYWSHRGTPQYKVHAKQYDLPPELRALRIPLGARPAKTSDKAMTVYDVKRGYVVSLWHAAFNKKNNSWSAGGAQVAYLGSNGLDADLRASNERRNRGSMRGNNGATSAVHYDEVRSGAIRHILKISSGPEVSTQSVLPVVHSDGDSSNPNAPAQGTRLRLKASVNLKSVKLSRQARVIARAMQRYGVYIGDSGGTTSLKLENTRVQGLGQRWNMSSTALCRLPLSPKYWKVVPKNYHPHR
ncbi:MAG: hypothetical protein ABI720_10305 [Actinomycetes bacterium]